MIPKFLFCEADSADDDDVRGYILHTEEPAFLATAANDDFGLTLTISQWFCDQNTFATRQLEAGIEPAATMARLIRQAHEFARECL